MHSDRCRKYLKFRAKVLLFFDIRKREGEKCVFFAPPCMADAIYSRPVITPLLKSIIERKESAKIRTGKQENKNMETRVVQRTRNNALITH